MEKEDKNNDAHKKELEEFQKKLTVLVNGLENMGNVPDFILAEYLTNCLKTFSASVLKNTEWHKK